MENIITYEKLFEVLRNEKSRGELQKLDSAFIESVVSYVKDKKSKIEALKSKNLGSRNQLSDQFVNISKLLRELFDRRESKILKMATNKARTGTKLINTSLMLKEEQEFYSMLVALISSNRKRMLENLMQGRFPDEQKVKLTDFESGKPIVAPKPAKPKDLPKKDDDKKALAKVKILDSIPKFIGKELEVYGPYNEGDVVELPEPIVSLLIKKNKAIKI